jgi:hypothetical protein
MKLEQGHKQTMSAEFELACRVKRIELELEFVIRYVRIVALQLGLREQTHELEKERQSRLDDLDEEVADAEPPESFPGEEPETKP